MEKITLLLNSHMLLKVLLYAVILDTVLGVLRAIKEHQFNSCIGIDGAIRKVAMILSVVFLVYIDTLLKFDLIGFIPDRYVELLGFTSIGIHELFCLLFVLYETVSILKNMTLCGLPVPANIKKWIQKFLDDMTDELPEEVSEELHMTDENGEKRLE